jgi:Condensation domain/TubC N-terminal docking domain
MKPIKEFLSELGNLDIKLWLKSNNKVMPDVRLCCNAPEGVLTPRIKEQIAERKTEIINFLQQVNLNLNSTFESIEPVAKTGLEIPLSFAQERLWFLNQLEGSSATYNGYVALHITGDIDLNSFRRALSEIVRRHQVLRTSFQTVNGTPIQIVDTEATINIQIVDLQQLVASEAESSLQQYLQQEAATPFDLEIAPLIRCSLLQLSNIKHVLVVTIHHIVSDAWSTGILIQELSVLYPAFCAGEPSPLPELTIQYTDFAIWQRQYLSGVVLETQLNYWHQHLQGAPELLQLPTDRPRPSIQTYRGTTQSFILSTDLIQKLQILSRESDATLFMTLSAAFSTLLHRYSGQSDILIGSPIANRNRSEIEPLIGFFANTLVLRTSFEDNPSFEQLLSQVRETTLQAYEHQDVPFERVVEVLKPERSLSHSPLFQVLFVLQNTPTRELTLPGITLRKLNQNSTTAKFDLTLSISESDQGFVETWEYNTDLFDESTIERMAAHYHHLLSAIVENPHQTVGQLPLLSEAERHQLQIIYSKAIATSYWNYKYERDRSNELQIYILDKYEQIVPLGVEGEIYICTSNIQNYLYNKPQKHLVNFVQHTQLGNLLKTGELCRIQNNHSFEYLGLEHRLVKTNGQRINFQK